MLLDTRSESQTTSICQISQKINELSSLYESKGKNRSSLFNLIIWVDSEAAISQTQELLKKILNKFPERVFFISSLPDYEELEARVHIYENNLSGHLFFSDLIFFQLPQSSQDLTKTCLSLLTHLLPDLSTYLYFCGSMTTSLSETFLKFLAPFVSKIIINSEFSQNFQQLQDLSKEISSNYQLEISDLQWRLTQGWRYLLSNFFQKPERRHLLHLITSIDIEYEETKTTSLQAIYLKKWLEYQLQVQPLCTKNTPFITMSPQKIDSELQISLRSQKSGNYPEGTILKVSLLFKDKSYLNSELKPQSMIRQVFTTPQLCELPILVPFYPCEYDHSFIKELFSKGTSEHYFNTLTLMTM